mgnify:CR=1 FL=1
MRNLYVLSFVVFFSCNAEDKCKPVTVKDIYGSAPALYFSVTLKAGETTQLRDKGIDGEKAGQYEFYDDGKIKSYKFFTSREAYTYAEYYNLNGILDSIEGTPAVYTNVEEISSDSLKLNFYIFNLRKDIKGFRAKVNNTPFDTYKVSDSSFSNLLKYSCIMNAKDVKEIKIWKEISYQICGGKVRQEQDSSYINRINH